MVQKSKTSRTKKVVKILKLRYMIPILVLLVALSAYELRQNNLHMITLRNQVLQADKNDGNVNQALNNLRKYVYSHMNTNLSSGNNPIYPPIQLKYTYQRLLVAAQAKATAQNNQYYSEAQNYCNNQNPSYTPRELTTCEEDYYLAQPHTIVNVPAALYEFDFTPPIWSPDVAGFSVLATLIVLLLTIIIVVLQLFYKIIDR
jgi:hypothetical protein